MTDRTSNTCDPSLNELLHLSRTIVDEKYLEDILQLVVMVIAHVTDIHICSLWLIDGDKRLRKIHMRASYALEPDCIQYRSLGVNEGLVGFIARQGRPVQVKNILADNRFKEKRMAKKLGLASMLGLPLKAKDGCTIGVITCFTTEPYTFSREEINRITLAARQAANAIQNTELMVRTQIACEELETQRLLTQARDVLMHQHGIRQEEADRMIQTLSIDALKSPRQIAESILLSKRAR